MWSIYRAGVLLNTYITQIACNSFTKHRDTYYDVTASFGSDFRKPGLYFHVSSLEDLKWGGSYQSWHKRWEKAGAETTFSNALAAARMLESRFYQTPPLPIHPPRDNRHARAHPHPHTDTHVVRYICTPCVRLVLAVLNSHRRFIFRLLESPTHSKWTRDRLSSPGQQGLAPARPVPKETARWGTWGPRRAPAKAPAVARGRGSASAPPAPRPPRPHPRLPSPGRDSSRLPAPLPAQAQSRAPSAAAPR